MDEDLELPWEPSEDDPDAQRRRSRTRSAAKLKARAWAARRRTVWARASQPRVRTFVRDAVGAVGQRAPGGVRSAAADLAALAGAVVASVVEAFRVRRRDVDGRDRTRLAAGLVVGLLLGLTGAGLAGVAIVRGLRTPPDYSSDRGTGEVIVQVRPGQTATDIAGVLHDAGVIRSVAAFIGAAEHDPASRLIQVGYYQLPRQISARSALDRLLARDQAGALVNKVSHRVTIPEGTITVDIYRRLAAFTHLPVADFQAAAADPIHLGLPAWWLRRDDGKRVLRPPSIEGFLYPDTYDIPPDATAHTILAMMVDRFLTVTGDLHFADEVQTNLHITPYEALVAASIAQVEAVYPQDMAGVARVLYNRTFDAAFPCRCLGLDSEVNYWLRVSGQKAQPSGQLHDRQLHDPKDPYNTHDQPGLPVGPISNPGRDALQGAMNPPHNTNLYFLGIDTAGHVAFARTYPQFCHLVHEAAVNGVSIGTCNP